MKKEKANRLAAILSVDGSNDDVETRERVKREINSARFRWHELVLKDPKVRKQPNALAIAGHIMHRFNSDRGYAEISAGSVERELGIPTNSVKRSRKWLVQQGWITVQEIYKPSMFWRGTRFSLCGGPDELLLEHHGLAGDTPPGGSISETVEGA
jgi:hypothetical protein